MKVVKREFVRQFSKYLKSCGSFELEGKGGVEYLVVISKLSDKKAESLSDNGRNMIDQDEKAYHMGHYGCGCGREEKVLMCGRHGRV